MLGEDRKKEILNILKEQTQPISGKTLADKFCVTRQIIVKDIALLRAEGNNIISTARGYIIQKNTAKSVRKKIKVCHDSSKIQEELQIVIDLGGHVLTTSIEHSAYGFLGEAINIKSRRDINNFIYNINKNGCEPLLSLTKGIHYHIIEADDDETLNEIIYELNKAGYLI